MCFPFTGSFKYFGTPRCLFGWAPKSFPLNSVNEHMTRGTGYFFSASGGAWRNGEDFPSFHRLRTGELALTRYDSDEGTISLATPDQREYVVFVDVPSRPRLYPVVSIASLSNMCAVYLQ